MFYDKKIKYLDYYENGSRVRGAGYVRLEARGQSLRLELSITALHPTDSFEREVFLCSGKEEKSVGAIRISGGRGQYLEQWPDSVNIGGTGISYTVLEGIHIPLGANREISCRWQPQKIAPARNTLPQKDESPYQAPSRNTERTLIVSDEISSNENRGSRIAEQEHQVVQRKTEKRESGAAANTSEHREIPAAAEMPAKSEIEAQSKIPGQTEIGTAAKTPGQAEIGTAAKTPGQAEIEKPADRSPRRKAEIGMPADRPPRREAEKPRNTPADSPAAPAKLLEDKWEQLWSIYPHLRPFRDKREYLSIRPADFVVFSSSSYRMINNSFLLHGYYNYKHLILTRVERKGEMLYYIGVPGNFFEKEKQVAIMFGFESFECAEEPAQAGDFGYYMMRTEL